MEIAKEVSAVKSKQTSPALASASDNREDRLRRMAKVNFRSLFPALLIATVSVFGINPAVSLAASASEIDRNVTQALTTLYQTTPGSRALAEKARGVLVFPNIVKAGFIVAGQYGDGALRERNRTVGFYRSFSASVGYQAGAQSFGYVLFFMDDGSLRYLDQSNGWEIGTGPSLVVLDKGFGKNLSTTTMRSGVYAFIFNQKGLMGGLGIQGSKITKINPG
jgi:lipid-binding SYLF domain-containing protein